MLNKYAAMWAILLFMLTASLSLPALGETEMHYDEQTSADGIYKYYINEDKTITLTSYSWSTHENEGDLVVPSSLDGYTVSAIGPQCYTKMNGHTIGSLVVPSSVRHIHEQAFYHLTINHIALPANLEVVEQGAFVCEFNSISVTKGCQNYTAIDGALYEKSTKTLIATAHKGAPILNGITTIGVYACYNIQPESHEFSVIPDSVTHICKYAYQDADLVCDSDNAFHIPASVVDEYAFSDAIFFTKYSDDATLSFNESLLRLPTGCFSNACVKSNKRVKYWSNTAFEYKYTNDDFNCDLLLHLPDSLTEIGDYAFQKFGHDKNNWNSDVYGSIVIVNGFPSSLVSIGISSFEIDGTVDIRALNAFAHNDMLTSIGSNAFNNSYLKTKNDSSDSLYIVLPDSLISLGENAFNIKNNTEESQTFVLPASLIHIGDSAFNKYYVTLDVQSGSYSETWAAENAYRYITNEEEDVSWLYE